MSFGSGDWVSEPDSRRVHASYPLPIANLNTLRGLDSTDIKLAMIVGSFGGLTTPAPYTFYVRDLNDTTSVDNGNTIIVGNSGARWHLMEHTESNSNRIDVTNPKFLGGAKGDNGTECLLQIQAAINSVPLVSFFPVQIYFPSGMYVIRSTGITNNGRHITLVGDGPRSSQLIVAAGVTGFTLDGNGIAACCMGLDHMGITQSGTQTGMVGISFVNCGDLFIQNAYITTSGKAIDIGAGAVFSLLSMIRIECYGAQEAIRFKSGGGEWSNLSVRKFRIDGVTGPCVYITGQETSLVVSNCSFGGKGTHQRRTISNITNAGATFAVTINTPTFIQGETLLISGTGTVYDGCWQTTTVVGAVVTITAATGGPNINPAAGTAFLDKLHATVCFDNTLGPCNESLWTNILFEGLDDGGSAGGTGSVSLLMDCTQGVSQMAGHTFTGCMYDCGQCGIFLIGKNVGGGEYLLSDLKFNGATLRYAKYGVYAREVRGVHIQQMTGDCIRANANAVDLATCSNVFLDVAGSQPIIGFSIYNSTIGREANLATGAAQAAFSPNYGIQITGTPQDLKWNNCHISGQLFAIKTDIAGNIISTNTRLDDTGTTYNHTAGGGESAATVIPTLASAASITIPYGPKFTISGAVAVNTLVGGWIGREVHFITTAALQFNTGVNIANALLTVAGQLVLAMYDGATWHLR